ncbi:S8 family serine peptidase [Actinoplanes subglobosus]|uniref:S8 family serine peptidase n=1 Tax=Actinoplanes subglobosus TaxID=1547892 RepID=A0ABV8IJU8_9ACTN
MTAIVAVGSAQALASAEEEPVTGPPATGKVIAAQPVAAVSSTVTLITGDRVSLRGDTMSVKAGPGRNRIQFISESDGEHRYVIPSDAVGLLRAERLDKRLFDIDALADQSGNGLRVLVSYGKNKTATARRAITAGDAEVVRDIPQLGIMAAETEGDSLWSTLTSGTDEKRALTAGLQRVSLDAEYHLDLDESVAKVGAPAAWKAGYDGTGVTVAVLDSGIDETHPDLAGQITETANFTTAASIDDISGHGTHVASTIAGTGAASGGRYKGVAPGAKLAIGKVCEDRTCSLSAMLAGMAWAAERVPVVNMSLGSWDWTGLDDGERAVNDLTARYGTLFVVAAGNDGYPGTVNSPSTADSALSVGAVDRNDRLAYFSSRGPRIGDGGLKPDMTAPGVDIVAAKATNGHIGTPAADGYVALSGTSMATPHVAGAAALLVQQHPDWSPKQRKNTLMAAANPTAGLNAYDQGAGRLDVARAITQTVTVDQGSVSFGVQDWPHDDDQPVTKTVTYRNTGTAAADLDLAVTGAAFTVADDRLTVPAGGTASTTVTADTRTVVPGDLGGHLTATATAGDQRVSTALGVVSQTKSVDVTVNIVDLDGTPATRSFTDLFNLDTGDRVSVNPVEGKATVSLVSGRYGAYSQIVDADSSRTALLTISELVVDRDMTITFDARTAKPLDVAAPQDGARSAMARVDAEWVVGEHVFSTGISGTSFSELLVAPVLVAPASPVGRDFFQAGMAGTFGDPGPDGTFHDSPWTADLAYVQRGAMFDGLTYRPELKDLAVVEADYAVEATGAEGVQGHAALYSAEGYGNSVDLTFDLPAHRTEYHSPGIAWRSIFLQQLPGEYPEPISGQLNASASYQAGERIREQWNSGVFAPTVTQPERPREWIVREGDELNLMLLLYGDGAGHPGSGFTENPTITLHQGDTKVGEGTSFRLPAEEATYRLEASDTRGAPFRTSTRVAVAWTFRSGHVDEPQRLPLSTVRFRPPLDDHNTAPGGTTFTIPLTVDHQPGSTAGTATDVGAEVSYDDGATWQRADVSGTGDQRTVTVTHPAGPGFVSLRASAADDAGNTVTQETIRAYILR